MPEFQVTQRRQLGRTGIEIAPIALGCWPIAGMTSLHVNDRDSEATLRTAVEHGINFLDTAYCYGADGESERLIAKTLRPIREQIVIASKGGIHWDSQKQRQVDGSAKTLRQECETSLQRLRTDHLDLLYLHAPDPDTPIEESAGELKRLLEEGKTRAVGASNCTVEQLARFQSTCPLAAVQPPYNMLQRQIESSIIPWCESNDVSVIVYWPLMKGLLAGKLPRDFKFEPGDGRAKYPMFQGEEWRRNQDFLDDLRTIAEASDKSVAQVVVNWTIRQRGVTAAICGAKRAEQIVETAEAATWDMSPQTEEAIDAALAKRGHPKVRGAV